MWCSALKHVRNFHVHAHRYGNIGLCHFDLMGPTMCLKHSLPISSLPTIAKISHSASKIASNCLEKPIFQEILRKIEKKAQNILLFQINPLPLHSLSDQKPIAKIARRDGRVVDCTGLENRRTERYRGFESLSLRQAR